MRSRTGALRTGIGLGAVAVVASCCVASSGEVGLHLHNKIEWAQSVHARSRS